jgi:hypothetical protein
MINLSYQPRCHTCIRYALSKGDDPASFVCEYPELPRASRKNLVKRPSTRSSENDVDDGWKEEKDERIKKLEDRISRFMILLYRPSQSF